MISIKILADRSVSSRHVEVLRYFRPDVRCTRRASHDEPCLLDGRLDEMYSAGLVKMDRYGLIHPVTGELTISANVSTTDLGVEAVRRLTSTDGDRLLDLIMDRRCSP